MPKIFISYRRDDSAVVAGRIFDRLQAHFGRSSVFMDVDSIPYGTDFRKHLTDAVANCDVLLAIIGGDWLTVQDNGRRRLDDPSDFVRIEIKAALDQGIRVVPILLGHTMMPLEEHLPVELKNLAYRHAAQVDPGKDFHLYMDRIVKKLEQLLAQPRTTAAPVAATNSLAAASVPTGASPASGPVSTPALDALVKSVQLTMAWNSTDTRGQVFAKLKITLGSVEAVFSYLEGLLTRADEDLVEKATIVLVKQGPKPSERLVRQANVLVQTSANPGVRNALTRELAALLKANQTSWDERLQSETVEALKFVAGYDAAHLVRLAAIESIGTLKRDDGIDFLVSIVRSKKGTGESTPDWAHAVSTLAKSGDVEAGRALAQLCSELHAVPEALQMIVYWVKCQIYQFDRFPSDVKNGLGEGAKSVLDRFDAINNPPFADAAFTAWISLTPEDAAENIAAVLDSGEPARRGALCRSLAAVEAQDQKKRFLRRLKQKPDAAKTVMEALQRVAADSDSDESLKQNAGKAMNLFQTT